MNFAEIYNHEKAKQEAKQGAEIITNTPINTTPAEFKVGDNVKSTERSHYKIFEEDNARITDIIKTCYGYYWYTVQFQQKKGLFKDNFKGTELTKI